jgi:hypothetical protein
MIGFDSSMDYAGTELCFTSSGKKDENPVIEFKNVSKHFGQTQPNFSTTGISRASRSRRSVAGSWL